MQSTSILLVLAALAVHPASCLRGATNHAFLANRGRLQPQVVAHSLFQMEDEWRSEAALFAECKATKGRDTSVSCLSASRAFEKSCATVVQAVQQASSGDRSVVKEYMGDVCAQNVLEGWRKERCQSLASTISGAMTADNYENREDLDVASLCENYWSSFAAEETARLARENAEAETKRVAREAEEKKLAEEHAEAAKKAAAEATKKAAEAAKKAAEETAKHKAEEAARQEAEAKRKAEEEKQKAEKEAEELKAKEEVALHKAEEAKKNMEAAKAAADEARQKREATAAKVSIKAVNATTAKATETVAKSSVNATKASKK